MHFVYANNPTANDEFNLGRLLKMKQTPNRFYNSHLDNYFFLKFIIANSDNFVERQQAEKELLVAEKKMKYWEREELFDDAMQERDIKERRAKWELTDAQVGNFILKKIYNTA